MRTEEQIGAPACFGAASLGTGRLSDRSVRRRVGTVWALLFFNGMTWLAVPTVVLVPQRVGQALTMGALVAALPLALSINPRRVIRPNLVLSIYTVLATVALMATVKEASTAGPYLRWVRLLLFLAVLWLLTPWWGRRDMLLARCHLRTLIGVSVTVLAGLAVAPSRALGIDGRLAGALWPIWPTAVAHYAAVAAGMAVVLWLSGSFPGSWALPLSGCGVAMVLLSQTRIALLALTAGVMCAGLSMLLARQRVRRMATTTLIVAPMAVVALAPVLITWFSRGQSAEHIATLTGRRRVWAMLLAAPRSEFNQWFGFGLSDKGFNGLAIDSTWLAAYQDTGLIGATLVGVALFVLFVTAAFRPATPARALAIFLLVYCAIDAYTEVGLADASPYLLDVIAAASLLARGKLRPRPPLVRDTMARRSNPSAPNRA